MAAVKKSKQAESAKPKAKTKPAAKKAAKPKFQKIQNVSGQIMSIPGALLRDKELSRKLTVDQINAMKSQLQPYIEAGMLKIINV